MVHFNPFDDSFLKHKIGSTENISAPNKVDETNLPSGKEDSAQNGAGIQKTDENDYLDTSDMIDDSADFSSNDFGEEDNSPQIDETNSGAESSNNNENNGKENQEEIMEEASQLMENFFDKKELNN